MSKGVVVDGDLAAQVRRLAGARSARAAAETVLREYVRRNGAESDSNGNEAARREQVARRRKRIFEASLAIARRGSPFYPGFNHKDLRKNRDFG